ncbi:hypothetical protein AAG570_003108 [Ranatra chinensis]|uniref:LysM domain-containing protein n=1 Tax=Ranatra chinensis TaxID=642074 RepID=A0ABD0Y6F4_9HEMI
MTEILMEERIAIRDSARSLKRYGSTGNNLKRHQETFLRHSVLETDTLQGLALKYGVTMEQIRRANRLWANDSLFLRKSLLIPVVNGESPSATSSPADVVLLEPDHQQPPSSSHNHNNNNYNNKDDANTDSSYNDFLVKIDCSIANTKCQVMMSQDNSQFVKNDPIPFARRKSGAMSRLRQHQHYGHHYHDQGELHSPSSPAEIPPVVMTQGRHVQNALQRLEREQHEMFEL